MNYPLIFSFLLHGKDEQKVLGTFVIDYHVYPKMLEFINEEWEDNDLGNYNFQNKNELEEFAGEFFCETKNMDILEQEFGIHDVGNYELKNGINFHIVSDAVPPYRFEELLTKWRDFVVSLGTNKVSPVKIHNLTDKELEQDLSSVLEGEINMSQEYV